MKRDDYNSGELEDFLYEIQQIFDDCLQEEAQEIARLYAEENPITIGQLVRFKSRELPDTFLRIMEVDEVEYSELSADDLAEFLLNKFSDEEFKIKANELFKIA